MGGYPPKFVNKQKIQAKIDNNSGKLWFGKIGQNLFWLLVYI